MCTDVFIRARSGLVFVCDRSALEQVEMNPSRRTDVVNVEITQQGRNAAFIQLSSVSVDRVLSELSLSRALILEIPHILGPVHCRHVFEGDEDEFVFAACAESVEFVLLDQRGTDHRVADRRHLCEMGEEGVCMVIGTVVADFHVEEGLEILEENTACFAEFVDAEHLNHES